MEMVTVATNFTLDNSQKPCLIISDSKTNNF